MLVGVAGKVSIGIMEAATWQNSNARLRQPCLLLLAEESSDASYFIQ